MGSTIALIGLVLAACSGEDRRAQEAEETAPPRGDEGVHAERPVEAGGPPFEAMELTREPTPTLAQAVPSPARIEIEGGALVVELRAPARIMESEPVIAELVVSLDDREVPLDRGALRRPSFYSQPRDPAGRPPGFVVAFRTGDGRVLSQRAGEPGNGGSGHTPGPIALPLWAYGSPPPGEHTLHVEATVHVGDVEHAVVVSTPIEVIPFDPARVGPIIEELGARAWSGDWDESRDAMDRLARVRDRRAVEHWARLAGSPRSERRARAIQELGRWPDARALSALVRATRARPDELSAEEYPTPDARAQATNSLRYAAVDALCRRGGDEAMRVVLAMHDDPHEQIRLRAMQCASSLPPAQARPYFERGLDDTYDVVRSEARRLLAELPRE